jgi:tripartite-type tricarboxylate transporter receptor subunit TctC
MMPAHSDRSGTRTGLLLLALLPLLLLPGAAAAQSYPTRAIRLIIPFPPGGPRDVQARLLGPRLTEAWGQPLVIDNRAGASGIIGADFVAKAPADGYTLLMISSGFAMTPALYPKLPYDTLRDFIAVAPLTQGPALLVIGNALPVKSLKDLLAYARARPGQLNYGSSGTGTPSHLAAELLASMAGIKLVHIPYKGMAPALTDVMGGQIQLSLPTIPGALPHVQAGRLRALGVSSSRRSAAAPEIPTIAEAGVAGYEATNWYGLAAAAATPPGIAAQINREIARVLSAPDARARLLAMGMETQTASVESYTQYLHAEVAKWAQVVKATGVQADTATP